MEHVPPPAEELALLDRELVQLDARRLQLLTRRAWLVSALKQPVAPAARPWGPPPGAGAPGWGPPPGPAARPWGGVPAAAPRSAQNVLLTLGGLLLAIAAIAFTLVSWGTMGIGGRAAVLSTVTLVAVGTPALLLSRKLAATAEALAALALLLTVLDAYALHAVAAPDTDGLGFTAAASAVLAALWAAYGLALGGLRLPLPAAVAMAQWPLFLWAWAAGAPALVFGWALLVTAAFDVVVALRGKGLAVRVTACVGATATGLGALLVALVESLTAGGPTGAVGPGALLLAGAAVALAGAWRAPDGFAPVAGAVAGLAAVGAVGGVLRATVPSQWQVIGYLLCGAALLAMVRTRVPRAAGRGVLVASAAVTGGSLVWALPPVAAVLMGPLSLASDVWRGAPGGFRSALGASVPWPQMIAAPVVLALLAAALGAAHRWWTTVVRAAAPFVSPGEPLRGAAGAGALVLGWSAVLLSAAALDVPYPVALALESALVAVALEVAVRTMAGPEGGPLPGTAVTALAGSALGAVSVGMLSLASEAATYAVFGLLVVLFAGAAVRMRAAVARSLLACAAVVWGIVLAAGAGASLGLAGYRAAPLMLVVPAVTVLLGARLRRHPVALPLELTGAFGAVVAVALAVPDAPFLALTLALCGVLAAGTAVRAERRPVAGYLAVGLFLAATWVRLAAAEVTDPEAYTLPVTVPALVVGVLRRRRDPAASSWTAYGAGLAVTLVPSLCAAWADPDWVRPLLLGVAALVATLLGARFRLQAVLLLGGTVLALVALHELAPYVVQVVGALPRWVPPALAGALLLAVGATYEQRKRDARRLREVLGRMR
ncbi:SCO7613 C-terminal domain-containing membrane protein [Streptomyces sp. TE33382]